MVSHTLVQLAKTSFDEIPDLTTVANFQFTTKKARAVPGYVTTFCSQVCKALKLQNDLKPISYDLRVELDCRLAAVAGSTRDRTCEFRCRCNEGVSIYNTLLLNNSPAVRIYTRFVQKAAKWKEPPTSLT